MMNRGNKRSARAEPTANAILLWRFIPWKRYYAFNGRSYRWTLKTPVKPQEHSIINNIPIAQ